MTTVSHYCLIDLLKTCWMEVNCKKTDAEGSGAKNWYKQYNEKLKGLHYLQALVMIKNLRSAFNELLAEVQWMDEPTRILARQKVGKNFQIMQHYMSLYITYKNESKLVFLGNDTCNSLVYF